MQNEIIQEENSIIKVKIQHVRNRKVTKISNIPDKNEEELSNLVKLLKKKLACGGSLNEDRSLLLQGDKSHTDLVKILKEQCNNSKIDLNGTIV